MAASPTTRATAPESLVPAALSGRAGVGGWRIGHALGRLDGGAPVLERTIHPPVAVRLVTVLVLVVSRILKDRRLSRLLK